MVAAPADVRSRTLTALILALVVAVVSTGLAEVRDILECEFEEFSVVHS
jgi:hypothetical protein